MQEINRALSVILLAAILISASSCAIWREPNLGEIYQERDREDPPHPVILIPGFLGSKLKQKDSEQVAWGKPLDVMRGGRSDRFRLPIQHANLSRNVDNLIAYDIYDTSVGARYYGDILRALELHGGYQRGEISRPRAGDMCFVFYYDWRRDLVESARKLGEAIENLRRVYDDPDLKVDLIAHSMGGLVARYYIMYGMVDVLDQPAPPVPSYAGASSVDRVILIATPNEGALFSLRTLDQGLKKIVEAISIREVFTMPSLYEMLPAPWIDPIVDPSGRAQGIDIYDAVNWEKYGWSVFGKGRGEKKKRRASSPWTVQEQRSFLRTMLFRAGRFHRALQQSSPEPAPVQFFTFGSDCRPTLDKAILRQTDGEGWEFFFPDRGARFDASLSRIKGTLFSPGDGVVTRRSLLSFPDAGSSKNQALSSFSYAYFLCGSHGFLTADAKFQNNLFYVLNHRRHQSRGSLPSRAARGM